MADSVHHGDGHTENPTVQYERTDARFRPLLVILIVALVLAVLIHLAIWWFYSDYRR
jgi:hypothetical protein